jgi:hypothetical protein
VNVAIKPENIAAREALAVKVSLVPGLRKTAQTINRTMEIAMGTPTMVQEAVEEFRSNTKGQVVLVLQGGGALGAYQVGVYEALHEAGVETGLDRRHFDWCHQR